VGGSVLSRVFAAILSRSEHCAAAFFVQGAKNYTDVKLGLLHRLILGTYISFVRKNGFLSPSVYCPDSSKRVPQIVTATETEWRNRFVRDWIKTKRAKNHNTLRDLNGGPEPLEKEIHEILGSKFEDRFSDPFFDLVQKMGSFLEPACLVIYVNSRGHCRHWNFPQKCQKIAGCQEYMVYGRIWFPTSGRLKTWLIPSGMTRSRRYHELTTVWRNLPLYHRL